MIMMVLVCFQKPLFDLNSNIYLSSKAMSPFYHHHRHRHHILHPNPMYFFYQDFFDLFLSENLALKLEFLHSELLILLT
jgi:hypothetical protein